MFYAVRGGSTPGVYGAWQDARYACAIKGGDCRRFSDRAAAEAFVLRERGESPVKDERVYLDVPFLQKDAARAAGARWDPACKRWYAPSIAHLRGLAQWRVLGVDGPVPAPRVPPEAVSVRYTAEDRALLGLRSPGGLLLYTAGSCGCPSDVAPGCCPAGWGVLVVGSMDQLCAELFGPVVVDAASDKFLGARVASNHAGELSGVCEALLWLRDCEGGCVPAAICYTSVFVANTTSGEYTSQKYKELVETARSLLEEVRQRREVSMRHVRGRGHVDWIDAVDRLVGRGCSGERCGVGRWQSMGSAAPLRCLAPCVPHPCPSGAAAECGSPGACGSAGSAHERGASVSKRRRAA